MTEVPIPKRERNPDATRRRILDAAEIEFARKGYDGARLRDVAQIAGVNHALLHHYFGDKLSIFRAVIENAFADVSLQAYDQMRKHSDLRELIPAWLTMLVTFHANRPNLARLLHLAAMDPASPAYTAIADVRRYVGGPVQEAISLAMKEGVARGEVRDDIEPRRLVALAMGAVSYLFVEDLFFTEFLGSDVHDQAQQKAHLEAAIAFVTSAVFRAVPLPPR